VARRRKAWSSAAHRPDRMPLRPCASSPTLRASAGTTRSVVTSITAVIVADAIIAVIFSTWAGAEMSGAAPSSSVKGLLDGVRRPRGPPRPGPSRSCRAKVVSLVGGSGSGKTTLLRQMLGLSASPRQHPGLRRPVAHLRRRSVQENSQTLGRAVPGRRPLQRAQRFRQHRAARCASCTLSTRISSRDIVMVKLDAVGMDKRHGVDDARGSVRRHDQARRTRPRARPRARAGVPRRADRRARSGQQ